MGPKQQTADLHILLKIIEEIGATAVQGQGSDEVSNAALKSIKDLSQRLTVIAKFLEVGLVDMDDLLSLLRYMLRS